MKYTDGRFVPALPGAPMVTGSAKGTVEALDGAAGRDGDLAARPSGGYRYQS
jgi:hypothetical protein